MSPEELFKIKDSEIPENKEEIVNYSEEGVVEKKTDIFQKDLTIEDLFEFLKKNNFSTNSKETIEKHYQEIIANNTEREMISETIKEFDHQKETLVQQIEKKPNDSFLLKKIQDIDDKISNLNTSERIREDNVKEIIKNIPRLTPDEIKTSEISEISQDEPIVNSISEISQDEPIVNSISEISQEQPITNSISEISNQEIKTSEISEISQEEPITNSISEIISDKFEPLDVSNDTDNTVDSKFEEIGNKDVLRETNPLEDIGIENFEKEDGVFENIEKNETLEELKKNTKTLDNISKEMTFNFELVLKTISESLQEKNTMVDRKVNDVEPAHVESPKISQPDYISEYRKSLRKYSGMRPFVGYDTELKGDNLGSYI
jgi:hypothetical protein